MGNGVGYQSFEDVYRSYVAQFSSVPPTFENTFKGFARVQLELMGLASRRTRAVMEAPTRFAQCRTPHDFGQEQLRFWRVAQDEYMESTERLVAAWQQMWAPAFYDSGMAARAGRTRNGGDGRSHIRLVRNADAAEDRLEERHSGSNPSNGAYKPHSRV